jgi:hypothetical protein
VIRRGFWLTAGAVTGIVAYRRASAVGRQIAGRLNLGPSLDTAGGRAATAGRAAAAGQAAGTSVGPPKPLISVRRTRRAAIRAARESYRFTRDVREGMELYLARHSEPAGSTLRTSQNAQAQALEAARRRAVPLEATPRLAARHDDTKDGR